MRVNSRRFPCKTFINPCLPLSLNQLPNRPNIRRGWTQNNYAFKAFSVKILDLFRDSVPRSAVGQPYLDPEDFSLALEFSLTLHFLQVINVLLFYFIFDNLTSFPASCMPSWILNWLSFCFSSFLPALTPILLAWCLLNFLPFFLPTILSSCQREYALMLVPRQ